MTTDTPVVSGEHRTMIVIELVHAIVVVIVVVCATLLANEQSSHSTFDAVGVVYGAAIAYAGGRAAASRQVFRRGSEGSQ